MQLDFSANLCFTPFTVDMPKKRSITFECTNPIIYLYVCVMWGEMAIVKGFSERKGGWVAQLRDAE